jgi:hypothetical protein
MMNRFHRRIGGLVALIQASPSALPLEAGKRLLRKKCLVLGTTQVLQHGTIHHPLAGVKAGNGTGPFPAIDLAALETLNRTELHPLVRALPGPRRRPERYRPG